MISAIGLLFLAAAAPEVDSFPHPILPEAASWPGVVVIVIVLGFFATAMVLGPVVRAIMREELPPFDGNPNADHSPGSDNDSKNS